MPLSGSRIKHYEILRQLGKGGMGEVWLAYDSVLDRQVAIKFLPEHLQTDVTARDRFIREAKAAAALDHPFICKIFETGESDGRAYIVMEYVEGCSLQEKMRETTLSTRDALQVAQEVADALEVAHAKGIIHRDLKPANIMCTPQGHSKVMDFGIAKRITPGEKAAATPQPADTTLAYDLGKLDLGLSKQIQATLTQSGATVEGTIMGTIDYMSPEQARGAPVDGRSDIFSLGVILYEMLSGKHPFSKTTPIQTLTSVIKDPPPSFNVKPKNINPVAHHIIKKCLAKNPADRYADIKEFSAEIKKAKDEIVGRLPFFLRGWWAAATGAVVLALVGLVVWRIVLPRTAETAPEPVSVLVADFVNQTNDPVFTGAVEQSIIIGLEEVSYINIYKREDARKKAAQLDPKAAGKLDAAVGQLVCQSEGIQTLIDGSIESKGGKGYLLKVRAIDPVTSKEVAAVETSVGKKIEVLNEAAVMTLSLCKKLGGGPIPSKESMTLETFTTSSLEAMNAYAKAQELYAQGKPDEAVKEYERTLEYDPNLGRAYSGLGALYYSRGDQKKAEEFYKKALQHTDRMKDREKWRTWGGYYLCTFNAASAIEQYGELVKRYPGDAAGHSMLAFAYFLARNMDKAYEEGESSLKLNPRHINTRYNFCWFALAAGEFERAAQETKVLIEANPKFEESYILAALAELTQGRASEAEKFYGRLEELGPSGKTLAGMGAADIALYEGRTAEAIKILEAGISFDVENDRKDIAALKAVMLGRIYGERGNKAQAVKYAERALGLSDAANILFCAGDINIGAGRLDKAAEMQAKFAKRIEPENQAYAKIMSGAIALARGEAVNAINIFKESQKHADSWLGRLFLGKAYLAAGAFAEAQAEFENCLARRGEATSVFFNDLPTFHHFPQVYYYLGLAQEGMSSAKAKESFAAFLKIKDKADAGDKMVEEARKRLDSR